MKRKRAKGGGRKSRAGPTSSLTFRIPDDLRRDLEQEANGESVSERLIWHLRRDINRKREEERDPALQGLLSLIARLAEEITGGELMADKDYRSQVRSEWRTDLFTFRAFKVAVKKLLDTLEEPRAPEPLLPQEELDRMRREAAEHFGTSPEVTKLLLEIEKSPEAKGAWVFGNFWTRFTSSHLPYPESARRVMGKHPAWLAATDREDRDFRLARAALELKPEREDDFAAVKRIMKDRNLDPENDQAPPDLLDAVKLINDKRAALLEAARDLPASEGLKFFRANPLPTLDEALKLLKLEKRKDKRR
jgi:hypothetical protein